MFLNTTISVCVGEGGGTITFYLIFNCCTKECTFDKTPEITVFLLLLFYVFAARKMKEKKNNNSKTQDYINIYIYKSSDIFFFILIQLLCNLKIIA